MSCSTCSTSSSFLKKIRKKKYLFDLISQRCQCANFFCPSWNGSSKATHQSTVRASSDSRTCAKFVGSFALAWSKMIILLVLCVNKGHLFMCVPARWPWQFDRYLSPNLRKPVTSDLALFQGPWRSIRSRIREPLPRTSLALGTQLFAHRLSPSHSSWQNSSSSCRVFLASKKSGCA